MVVHPRVTLLCCFAIDTSSSVCLLAISITKYRIMSNTTHRGVSTSTLAPITVRPQSLDSLPLRIEKGGGILAGSRRLKGLAWQLQGVIGTGKVGQGSLRVCGGTPLPHTSPAFRCAILSLTPARRYLYPPICHLLSFPITFGANQTTIPVLVCTC